MLEQEETIPKLFPRSWDGEIVQISWYAEALRFSLTGNKGPSRAPDIL